MFLEGWFVCEKTSNGSVFFLGFFNYEDEADTYIEKYPDENLKKIKTEAEFPEELFDSSIEEE